MSKGNTGEERSVILSSVVTAEKAISISGNNRSDGGKCLHIKMGIQEKTEESIRAEVRLAHQRKKIMAEEEAKIIAEEEALIAKEEKAKKKK